MTNPKRGEGKLKYKIVISTLISILCLACGVKASAKQFAVQFVVPASNELTDQVKSYGIHELRSLHDVKLIGADPTLSSYHISIYPLLLTLSNGIRTVVVVSYVIEKDGVIEHAVLTGPPDQLKTLVDKVIARFDAKWLEPERHK
jgi:hypothetical protein